MYNSSGFGVNSLQPDYNYVATNQNILDTLFSDQGTITGDQNLQVQNENIFDKLFSGLKSNLPDLNLAPKISNLTVDVKPLIPYLLLFGGIITIIIVTRK